ncbi:MAG: hypothetical protein K1X86_15570 [Ignavibacteria bacterium]|nr:hypothetical protein [Ignavibacteria bacterium]
MKKIIIEFETCEMREEFEKWFRKEIEPLFFEHTKHDDYTYSLRYDAKDDEGNAIIRIIEEPKHIEGIEQLGHS